MVFSGRYSISVYYKNNLIVVSNEDIKKLSFINNYLYGIWYGVMLLSGAFYKNIMFLTGENLEIHITVKSLKTDSNNEKINDIGEKDYKYSCVIYSVEKNDEGIFLYLVPSYFYKLSLISISNSFFTNINGLVDSVFKKYNFFKGYNINIDDDYKKNYVFFEYSILYILKYMRNVNPNLFVYVDDKNYLNILSLNKFKSMKEKFVFSKIHCSDFRYENNIYKSNLENNKYRLCFFNYDTGLIEFEDVVADKNLKGLIKDYDIDFKYSENIFTIGENFSGKNGIKYYYKNKLFNNHFFKFFVYFTYYNVDLFNLNVGDKVIFGDYNSVNKQIDNLITKEYFLYSIEKTIEKGSLKYDIILATDFINTTERFDEYV